jgi:ABC-type antimicrobial peptide transport system permease subunit
MTLGTAVTAVLFSTILGALAGFVPAMHAARLDPVSALRYE